MRRSPRPDRPLTHASFLASLLALLLPCILQKGATRALQAGTSNASRWPRIASGMAPGRSRSAWQEGGRSRWQELQADILNFISPEKAANKLPVPGIAIHSLQPDRHVQRCLAHLQARQAESRRHGERVSWENASGWGLQ